MASMKCTLLSIFIVFLSVCTLETLQEEKACSSCPKLSDSNLISHFKLNELLECSNQTSALEFSKHILESCPQQTPSDADYCARFKYTALKPRDATVTYEVFYRLCFSENGLEQGCMAYLKTTNAVPAPPTFQHISPDDSELQELMPSMKLKVLVCDEDACGREYDRKYGGGNDTVACKEHASVSPVSVTQSPERVATTNPSSRAPSSRTPNSKVSSFKSSFACRVESFIVLRLLLPVLILIKSV